MGPGARSAEHQLGSWGAKVDILDKLAAGSVVMQTDRSDEIGDCLVWTAGKPLPHNIPERLDYRLITFHKVTTGVHRAAWAARHGPIPAETPFVLHHCDNPPCWRDEHLFLGTHAQNMADMVAKGRTWRTRLPVPGVTHGY